MYTSSSRTALAELAEWAADVGCADPTPTVADKVLDSLVDTVGVAIAGAHDDAFAPVRTFLSETAASAGDATLWHDGGATNAGTAAFANATAGHLLDFDDVHYTVHGHPTTVLLPAVLAVAQQRGAEGARVLSGVVAGLGVMAAVARVFGPEHYARGWHSTSTCGVIGAAAGAAVVLGLPPDRIRNAMAIAVSRAAGVRANFGTLLKPMHAGFAARDGVEAALLSAAGVDAASDPLESPLGGLALFGDGTWDAAAHELRSTAESAPLGLGLKLYPCCRGAHFAVDAALEVHAGLPAAAPITRVEVIVPLGSKTALIHDDPQTGLEAKFSLPYTVATALVRGLPLVEHFTDDAVRDPRVREVMARLHTTLDDSRGDLSATMTGRYAEVDVVTADGARHRARVDDARGSASRPLSAAEVDAKFVGAVAPSHGPEGARELLARVRALASAQDVRALFSRT